MFFVSNICCVSLDDGVLSQEEFNTEKAVLVKERDERKKAAEGGVPPPPSSLPPGVQQHPTLSWQAGQAGAADALAPLVAGHSTSPGAAPEKTKVGRARPTMIDSDGVKGLALGEAAGSQHSGVEDLGEQHIRHHTRKSADHDGVGGIAQDKKKKAKAPEHKCEHGKQKSRCKVPFVRPAKHPAPQPPDPAPCTLQPAAWTLGAGLCEHGKQKSRCKVPFVRPAKHPAPQPLDPAPCRFAGQALAAQMRPARCYTRYANASARHSRAHFVSLPKAVDIER